MTIEDKKTNVQDLYNDISTDYSNEFFTETSDNEDIMNFLSSLRGPKILDAGCGDGRNVKLMLEKRYDPMGVDFAEDFLKIAREKVPTGRFEIADITDLSQFDENTFDGILANCSLQHVPAELLNQTLSGFRKILKPNGQILVILPSSELGEHMIDEPYRPGKKLYTNYLSIEQMRELLIANQFMPIIEKTAEVISEGEIGSGKLIFQALNKKHELVNNASFDNQQVHKV